MPETNRIFLGVQGKEYLIDPANADVKFQEAIDDLATLAPLGGDLYVLPGTQKYEFRKPVQLNSTHGNAENVTFHFSSGAILDFHPDFAPVGREAPALFVIQKRGFRCIGARVEHTASSGAAAAGRSCFLISDELEARDSDGAAFEHCSFLMGQSGSDVRAFTCIRAIGKLLTNPRRGLLVSKSTFTMLAGDRQTAAWNGQEPYGVCGVRAHKSAETLVHGSRFHGDPDAATGFGQCGPMIYLHDSGENSISSSIFRKLDLSLTGAVDPQDPPALVRISSLEQEGHHTLLTANIFTEVDATWLVELENALFDVIVANLFSKYGSTCSALVIAGSRNSPEALGSTLVLGANVFRDVPGGTASMVHLSKMRNVTIAGGAYSDLPPGKQPILIDARCSNVVIAPNEPRSFGP